MTMNAEITAASVTRDGAKYVLNNNGMAYAAMLNAPLGRNTNFVKRESVAGRKVYIEFTEVGGVLNISQIDFIK